VVPPPTRLDKCTREMIDRAIRVHYDMKKKFGGGLIGRKRAEVSRLFGT